ncbi:MAG: cytochrome-c peroxidase, partial [Pseudomonadota bacterium]
IDHPDQISFPDISNAIAAFMAFEWRSDTAPFDAVLRGEVVLAEPAATGMNLFYGAAGCAGCHSGPFLTDHAFHAMGAPQIGPGKAARFETHSRDEGRYRVTGNPDDLYAFRTPSLRNVALTAPYGHAGAHSDLRDFLRAHVNPAAGLQGYDITMATLPDLPVVDVAATADAPVIAASIAAAPLNVTEADLDALIAFLHTLTDPTARDGRLGVPETVPSGLPVDQP